MYQSGGGEIHDHTHNHNVNIVEYHVEEVEP